jgi:hypothetical protein
MSHHHPALRRKIIARISPLAVLVLLVTGCMSPTRSPASPTPASARIVFATELPTPTLIRFPADSASVTPTLARVAVLTPSATRAAAAVAATLDASPGYAYVANTGGEGATMRRAPGGESMGVVIEGAIITPTGRDTQVEGRAWREVQTTDGRVGWIAAEFVANAPVGAESSRSEATATPRMPITVIPTVTHAVAVPTPPRSPTPARSPLVPRAAPSPTSRT